MTKATNLEISSQSEDAENTSSEKRPYSTPQLTEETVFERAVLASCKVFGVDPSCEGSPS